MNLLPVGWARRFWIALTIACFAGMVFRFPSGLGFRIVELAVVCFAVATRLGAIYGKAVEKSLGDTDESR